MEIRKLFRSDANELYDLISIIEKNLENKEFWLPLKPTAKEHFFDENWTEFYGIFDGTVLVGAVALFYNEYEYGESLKYLNRNISNVAEIGRAMVRPNYRGNNILYLLNTKLIEVAKAKNIENLIATIHPQNIPSQKSFLKLGMKKQCTYIKSNGYVRDIYLLTLK